VREEVSWLSVDGGGKADDLIESRVGFSAFDAAQVAT